MRGNNINQIKIDVARNSTITLTINKNKYIFNSKVNENCYLYHRIKILFL